jgi:hypothetical protein
MNRATLTLLLACAVSCAGEVNEASDETGDALPQRDSPAQSLYADATSADAPAVDVMQADSSPVDALAVDVARADSSSADAPAVDVMQADSSSVDAPTVDAMHADSSSVDASPADSAIPDSALAELDVATMLDGAALDSSLSAASHQYVDQFATPYCARLAACCAQNGISTSGLAACEAYELQFVQRYLDDGSSVINPAGIAAVLDVLQTSCNQPSYALLATTTVGTRNPGDPCIAVDQCKGDPILCLGIGNSSPGTCVVPRRGKAGDACVATCDDTTTCQWGTGTDIVDPAVCYEQDGVRCDDASDQCVALVVVGNPCSASTYDDCGVHATCSYVTSQCVANATVGEDCSNDQTCDSTLICNGQTCVSTIADTNSCNP